MVKKKLELEKIIWEALSEMTAIEPIALDLKAYSTYCDTLRIATGSSDRHLRAMADRVVELGKKEGARKPIGIEGIDSAQWVLIDYGDVVVHLFEAEARSYYDLEGMWR